VINLAWDHNSYYQPRLLRALPAPCERVLDVGCGKGEFAIRQAAPCSRSRPVAATGARCTADLGKGRLTGIGGAG
jgi:ubiquinone/menaquinone biosynthesis C-methylase UbiE